MLSPSHALDQVCRACARKEPMPEDLRDWMAESLARFLEHGCENLNEAFGIRQGHGGIPWWRERAIRARDEALRDLAMVHFGHVSLSARAQEIEAMAKRYAGTNWPRDRENDVMPARYVGTPMQLIWRAFKSGAKMPVSKRHLRNLLSEN